MLTRWLTDLESLEAVSQDDSLRQVMLVLAARSRAGRMEDFLRQLESDQRLDVGTKAAVVQLAGDADFLAAFEEYVRATGLEH